MYVDGQPRALPGAIGLVGPVAEQTAFGPFYGAQQCYYWLHTHTGDGVIHVESPSVRVYTLGNFFDEWRQPLSRNQVAGAQGKVTAFVNGKPWTKDPRTIPLVPTRRFSSTWARPPSRPTPSRGRARSCDGHVSRVRRRRRRRSSNTIPTTTSTTRPIAVAVPTSSRMSITAGPM